MPKGCPGLIGLVLDEAIATRLKGLTLHPNVKCHHITMAYRPDPDTYSKYAPLIGQRIEFDIDTLVQDDLGQAVTVSGVPSEKPVPHITLSVADGVHSNYSNTLVINPHASVSRMYGVRGAGKVEFVSL